jgi:hypothetical protein
MSTRWFDRSKQVAKQRKYWLESDASPIQKRRQVIKCLDTLGKGPYSGKGYQLRIMNSATEGVNAGIENNHPFHRVYGHVWGFPSAPMRETEAAWMRYSLLVSWRYLCPMTGGRQDAIDKDETRNPA